MKVILAFILILFLVLLFSALLYAGAQKVGEWWRFRPGTVLPIKGEVKVIPAKESEYDLTQLSKGDYDFLRDNGVEASQEVHDHFYPPHKVPQLHGSYAIYRQPLDKWGANAIDLVQYSKRDPELAAEQREAIAQQKEMLAEAKAKRMYEQAVQWNGTWIDSEKIRG